MNSIISCQKLLGKKQNFSIKMLCLSLLVCIVSIGSFSFAATAPTPIDNFIKFSLKSDRSNLSALDGKTISGIVYITVTEPGLDSNSWWLDTNGDFDNSKMTSGQSTAHWDFAYTQNDGSAKPFDTKMIKDGIHTLVTTSKILSTGKYVRHTAIFTVANTVAVTTTTKPATTTVAPTTVAPTTVAPTTTTTAPPAFVPSFAGDVKPGNIRWGSSIGGNGDPVARHGVDLANRMGIRRTFWDMNKTSSLVSTAKADLAAGRLPWVSVKLNGSWKENADGKYDASMVELLTELSALNGPVWFTVHHEPEGGASSGTVDDAGGPTEWIRMQENTSKLLKQLRAQGKGKNIGFSSILMGWTFQLKSDGKTSASGRNPLDWFKPGIWDFAGLDAYADNEATTPLMDTNGLQVARKFYGDRGLKIAIGEWGIRNQSNSETDAGEIPTLAEQTNAANRMQNYYADILASAKDGRGAQIIGASYFDSGLNSPKGTWELRYLQLDKFRELIPRATSLRANQN